MLLEWGLFSSAALLVGWIGTTALAAHQIALQIAAILFMVPFGISLAATVRVGHAVGRRDSDRGAPRRASPRLALGVVFMVALTLIVVAFREHHSAALPRRGGHGGRRDGASRRHPAAGRRDLLRHRRHAGHRGRRAARAERHPRAAALAALSFWVVGFTSAYALAFWSASASSASGSAFRWRCCCSPCC